MQAIETAATSRSDGRVLAAAVILVAGILCAYHNSFGVPLLLDDRLAIAENPSIARLGALGQVLWAPPEVPTAGRPLLNLSFALNWAMSGPGFAGYHVVNVLIHCLAGLTLFGLLRRTLAGRAGGAALQRDALWLALGMSAWWAWHPLPTAAVTYISQRAESLMGLLYLATLYAFVRATAAPHARPWLVLSAVVCWAGMATKEVMVTAPLLVLGYDRVFVSGSFASAWRARRGYYAALGASWVFLAILMVASRIGERSVGFDQGVNPLWYALGETRVVAEYLKLSLWPVPLVFDYGFDVLRVSLARVIPCALGLGVACVAILRGWRRRPAWSFVAVGFFVLLAPTSSFVPVAMQPMAESRMYLPLAAVVVAVTSAAYRWAGRKMLPALGVAALAGVALTIARNEDYRSELSIWSDTVAKVPASARAQNSLAYVLARIPGRSAEAIAGYEESARLRPDYVEAHYNLATELARQPQRVEEAIARYERVLAIQPTHAKAHHGLANLLVRKPGRIEEGVRHYEAALRLRPDFAEAHYNFGTILAGLPGGAPLAIEHYEVALKINPDYAEAHNNLANELARLPGRGEEARSHYETALRLRPDFPEAHNNFATLLAGRPERRAEALTHLETAIRLKPDFIEAHYNLAAQLEKIPGRLADAIARYAEILRIDPRHADTHNALAGALYKAGRLEEAIRHLETALQINPDHPDAPGNLQSLRALRK